jgi:hypothetical protein
LSGWDQAANYLFERLQQRIDLATLCLEAAPGAASSSNYLFFLQSSSVETTFEQRRNRIIFSLRCFRAAGTPVEQQVALPGSSLEASRAAWSSVIFSLCAAWKPRQRCIEPHQAAGTPFD